MWAQLCKRCHGTTPLLRVWVTGASVLWGWGLQAHCSGRARSSYAVVGDTPLPLFFKYYLTWKLPLTECFVRGSSLFHGQQVFAVWHFARAAVTKHRSGQPDREEHILWHFWRLEAHNRGVGRVGIFRRSEGRIWASPSPRLADGCLFPVSSHACLCVHISS